MSKKRILSLWLIFILAINEIVFNVPIYAHAQETESYTATSTDADMGVEEIENSDILSDEQADINVEEGEISFESSDPFSDIFVSEYAEEIAEKAEAEDYKIYAISIEERKQATVTYNTLEDCLLILTVFDETTNSLSATFTKQVAALETETTIEIDKELPQYYFVRAYLVTLDEQRPLSTEFESVLYTQQMQELMQLEVSDFEEERVINFDDDETNNFAVYGENVIFIDDDDSEKNTVTSVDDENKAYVIENINDSVRNLQPGDIFTYNYDEENDLYLIVKIETIEITGTTAQITGQETTLEEVFDYVKVDESAGVEDVQVDENEELDGATFVGIYEEVFDDNDQGEVEYDEVTETDDNGEDVDQSYVGVSFDGKKEKVIKYNLDKTVKGKDGNNAKLSGSLDVTVGLYAKLYVSKKRSYLEVYFEINGNVNGKTSAAFKHNFTLSEFNFNIGVLKVKLKNTLIIEFDGYGNIKVTFNAKVGARISTDKGFEVIKPKPTGDIKAAISAKLYVGIKSAFDASVKVPIINKKLCTISMWGQAGLLASIKNGSSTRGDGHHACKACLEGEVHAKIAAGLETYVIGVKKLSKTHNFDKDILLTNFYYSLDHNEFKLKECPYYNFPVEVYTYNKANNKAISGAQVTIKKSNGQVVCSAKTSAKGKVSCEIPAGKYSVTVTYGGKSYPQDITIKDAKIQLSVPFVTVGGVTTTAASVVMSTNTSSSGGTSTTTSTSTQSTKPGDYSSQKVEPSVNVNSTTFPDAAFRTYLSNTFDKDKDGRIKLKDVTAIDCSGKNISSLKGIENFTNLKSLDCTNNNISTLDVSKLVVLEELSCFNNRMNSLNISGCSKLRSLVCADNELTNLSVTKNKLLTDFDCSNNRLISLDINGLGQLNRLNCSNNRLTSLDVSKMVNLEYLSCYENNLISLNVIGCSKLMHLDCSKNLLLTLDLSGCISIVWVYCQNNKLTSLNLSGMNTLGDILCANNQITKIDVSGCPRLYTINVINNPLEQVVMDNCNAMQTICEIRDDEELAVDYRFGLILDNSMHIKSISANDCYDLRDCVINNCKIDFLSMKNCPNIERVHVNGGMEVVDETACIARLKKLDLSGSNCIWISCLGCELETLVLDNSNVSAIDVRKNKLTSLDVSSCINLEELNCDENSLKSLDVKGCKLLSILSCSWNGLRDVDASGCKRLFVMAMMGNPLESVDVSDCDSLYCIVDTDEKYDSVRMLQGVVLGNDVKLTSLNADGCWYIDTVELDHCSIGNLSLQNCDNLRKVLINGNRTSVDLTECKAKVENLTISDCPKLDMIETVGCDMSTITVDNCSAWLLDCKYNKLESIDISTCPNLTRIDCSNNGLKALDVSGLNELSYVDCSDNQIVEIDASGCNSLLGLITMNNPIKTVNLNGCASIETIIDNSKADREAVDYYPVCIVFDDEMCAESVSANDCPKLERVELDYCSIDNLSFKNCENLERIFINGNYVVIDEKRFDAKVKNLDVSNCLNVRDIRSVGCSLETINLTNCGVLSLDCRYNKLTALDVSTCSNLIDLKCKHNDIQSVDTSMFTHPVNVDLNSPDDEDIGEDEIVFGTSNIENAMYTCNTNIGMIVGDAKYVLEIEYVVENAPLDTDLSEGSAFEEITYNYVSTEIDVNVENDLDEVDDDNIPTDEENSNKETTLFPDETYNVYVFAMYNDDMGIDAFSNDNLLYVRQCVTDAYGKLPSDFIPKLDVEEYVVIAKCAKQNLEKITGIETKIEDIEANGEEQNVVVAVFRNNQELMAGIDYVLGGDFVVTEAGNYVLEIIGTGMYEGMITVEFTVASDPTVVTCTHSFKNYVSDNNATCFADGTKTALCEFGCGAKDVIIDEGSKLNFGWNKTNGSWVYYNSAGKKVINWQSIEGKWYYFNASGIMQTGWKKIGTTWYYFNASGIMQTGWLKSGTTWYYFATNGAMTTGWQKIDNSWYYFDSDGKMATGWQKISDKWYYFGTNGIMTVGWKKINEKWYYFATSGTMVTGWKQISDKWYYFGTDGVMTTGWKQISTKWYYFESSGVMAVSKWINDTYYVKADGTMATNEWIGKYYVDANGKYVKGKTK